MISPSVLKKIDEYKKLGKRTVLVGGCFDLIHPGHIIFLKKAKQKGDVLIILLESDENVKKMKQLLIQTQSDRFKILKSLKTPDIVIPLSGIPTDNDYYMIVKTIKPDIIAVTENDPLQNRKSEQADSVGGKLIVVTKRMKKYSSSKMKEKIKL